MFNVFVQKFCKSHFPFHFGKDKSDLPGFCDDQSLYLSIKTLFPKNKAILASQNQKSQL